MCRRDDGTLRRFPWTTTQARRDRPVVNSAQAKVGNSIDSVFTKIVSE
jgi:hypothetical protein